jgi:hypothetical protein
MEQGPNPWNQMSLQISNSQYEAVDIKDEPITSFDNFDPIESNEEIVDDPIWVNSNQMSSSLSEQSVFISDSSTTVKANKHKRIVVVKVNQRKVNMPKKVSKTYLNVRDRHWKELKEFTQKDTKWTHEEMCDFFLMLKTKKSYSNKTLHFYVTTITFKFENSFPPARFKEEYPKLVPFIRSLQPVELNKEVSNDSDQLVTNIKSEEYTNDPNKTYTVTINNQEPNVMMEKNSKYQSFVDDPIGIEP